ncbi:CIC11C00000005212 [Sungouiella intermedia]|uniref:CIC11C00000005212 n=1 Tax=Sungouiella intermedia TaxID=45354 RepID=A0A1L0DNK5_9ASCO|nr:CIC11C00000005212 [[Candida] intermedia]
MIRNSGLSQANKIIVPNNSEAMIQKYTCVPVDEYDVLIVTNGAVHQVEQALHQLNERTDNDIPLNATIVYLDSFEDLVTHLRITNMETISPTTNFKGKTVFMFFNGLEYIQNFICEVIDYYGSLVMGFTPDFHKARLSILNNSYYYFDSSVATDLGMEPTSMLSDSVQFNYIVTIVNDILKKMSFMLHRIRGVYLDDIQFNGERLYPLQALLRNFPNLERVDLASEAEVCFREIVV